MEQVIHKSNKLPVFAAIAITLASAFGFASFHNDKPAVVQVAQEPVRNIVLSTDGTGTAIVNLDGFTLDTSFDFESLGHDDFRVNSLEIKRVVDQSGHQIQDFTTFQDHVAINQMLVEKMASNFGDK